MEITALFKKIILQYFSVWKPLSHKTPCLHKLKYPDDIINISTLIFHLVYICISHQSLLIIREVVSKSFQGFRLVEERLTDDA